MTNCRCFFNRFSLFIAIFAIAFSSCQVLDDYNDGDKGEVFVVMGKLVDVESSDGDSDSRLLRSHHASLVAKGVTASETSCNDEIVDSYGLRPRYDSMSRSAVAEIPLARAFSVTASDNSTPPKTATGTVTETGGNINYSLELTVGTWTVTAKGYTDSNKTTEIISGEKSITVPLASPGDVNITLSAITTGTGAISLPVEVSNDSGVTKAAITLKNSSGSAVNISPLTFSPSALTQTISVASTPKGVYDLSIKFYKTVAIGGTSTDILLFSINEEVTVSPALTTNKWVTAASSPYISSGKVTITKALVDSFLAKTFYVKGTDGSLTEEASDSNSGGWASPFATIQKAVNTVTAINDGTSEYTIFVDGTLKGSGACVSVSPTSALKLKIQSLSDTTKATLDANNTGGVVKIDGTSASSNLNVTLENLIITKGGGVTSGAGVYAKANSTVEITDCEIKNNTANVSGKGGLGAGVCVVNSTLTIENTKIQNNTAGTQGGGIFVMGTGNTTISGATISSNSSPAGSAIFNSGGTVEINQNTTINKNNNSSLNISGGSVNIENSTISESTVYGLHIENNGEATLKNCNVTNISSNNAYGIFISDASIPQGTTPETYVYVPSGKITITDGKISGNKMGGLCIQDNTALCKVTNCEISDNDGLGGVYVINALQNPTSYNEVELENCQIKNNLGYGGVNVKNKSQVTLKNCSVTNNPGSKTGDATNGYQYCGGISVLFGNIIVDGGEISGNTYGGAYIGGSSNSIFKNNCVIKANYDTANADHLPGIDIQQSTISIQNCAIGGESATDGNKNTGVRISLNGSVTLTDSTINNNQNGGVVVNGGTATLTNTTISNNTGLGGIYVPDGVSSSSQNIYNITLDNCTINGNTDVHSKPTGIGIGETDCQGTLTIKGATKIGSVTAGSDYVYLPRNHLITITDNLTTASESAYINLTTDDNSVLSNHQILTGQANAITTAICGKFHVIDATRNLVITPSNNGTKGMLSATTVVSPPTISIDSDNHVHISSTTTGAICYYTKGDASISDPTSQSSPVSTSTTITLRSDDAVSLIKAIAIKNGVSSAVASCDVHSLSFEMGVGYTDTVDTQYFGKMQGQSAITPVHPSEPAATKTNYEIDGWYENSSFTGSAYNFSSASVTQNKTLYPKWKLSHTINVTGLTQDDITAFNFEAGNEAYSFTGTISENNLKKIMAKTENLTSTVNFDFSACTGNFALTQDTLTSNQKINSLSLPNGITSIASGTFDSNNFIHTVTFGEQISSIDNDAFYNCPQIENINVNSNNTHYKSVDGVLYNKAGDSLLKFPVAKSGQFVIPNTVESIENKAFADCLTLTTIEIPSSVESIGISAFSYCTNLTTVTFANGAAPMLFDSVFSNCTSISNITIPSTITDVAKSIFENWTASQTINVPYPQNSLPSTWDSAWNASCSAHIVYASSPPPQNVNTSDISSLSLQPGGSYSFSGSISSNDIDTLFNKLDQVSGDAVVLDFSGCTPDTTPLVISGNTLRGNVKEITFPNVQIEIQGNAFQGNQTLEKVTIPNVASIPDGSFSSCQNLTEVNLGTVTGSIGNNCFSQCTSLQSIEIPSGVTSLGSRAFSGCTSLQTVQIDGNTVTSISEGCFAQCTSLQSIVIPEGVTSLGTNAFQGCTSLSEVHLPDSMAVAGAIGDQAFSACQHQCDIYVPFTDATDLQAIWGTQWFDMANSNYLIHTKPRTP